MIYYCPVCKKIDINYKNDKNILRVVNCRDGYGRPLYHVRCECGNYLAAYISFTEDDIKDDSGALDYIKGTIEGYNKGGIFYNDGYYEYVEKDITDRYKRTEDIIRERNMISKMNEEEKTAYFDNKYNEMKMSFLETE